MKISLKIVLNIWFSSNLFKVVKSEYFKDPTHYLFKDPTCVSMFSPQCLNWTDYPHIVDSKDHGHMDIQNRLLYVQSLKLCRHHQTSTTFTNICPTTLLQHVGSYFRNKKQSFFSKHVQFLTRFDLIDGPRAFEFQNWSNIFKPKLFFHHHCLSRNHLV